MRISCENGSAAYPRTSSKQISTFSRAHLVSMHDEEARTCVLISDTRLILGRSYQGPPYLSNIFLTGASFLESSAPQLFEALRTLLLPSNICFSRIQVNSDFVIGWLANAV